MKTPSAEELRKIYPDSDGKPMAENTLQLEWIVLLKFGLEACYDEIQDVFVAADLLWYPVEGHPEINVAPDVMVAFGRPKGHRGSYIQFVEENVAPQVVFEIISPGNRKKEMENKLAFYQKYGIQEYYTYDPQRNIFQIYVRSGEQLVQYPNQGEWVSPRLKVKFEWNEVTLNIFQPDGDPFLSYHELREFKKQAVGEFQKNWAFLAKEQRKLRELQLQTKWTQENIDEAKQKIANAEQKAALEKQKAEMAEQKAEVAEQKAEVAEQKAEMAEEKIAIVEQKAEMEKQRAFQKLLKAGLSITLIAEALNLSAEEVQKYTER